MVDGFELKSINHLTLQIRVQRFDVSVVLRCGYMGELLVDTFFFQVFADNRKEDPNQKLSAVITPNSDLTP